MKYITALFLFALMIAGCGKEAEQKPVDEANKYAFDSTDIKTTEADNPNETFNLAYKIDKGEKLNYRLTTIAKDNQVIQVDTTVNQNASQNIVYLFTLTGKDVDSEGVMEVEGNVTSIKLDAQGGSQSFSYESGKADSAARVTFADYESFVNNPFSMRISPKGELLEIFRVDKIVNRFLELKGYADSVTAEEKNVLRREFSEGAIRQLMHQVFREVPQQTLAKDSVWRKEQQPGRFMIFNTQNTSTYKVENLEMLNDDKLAVIEAGLITSVSGNQTVTQRGATYHFQKPVTNAEGKIYFNLDEGVIQKSRTKTIITISFTAEAQTPMGLQKGNTRQVIENTNILELL